jgi:hypothetical protein
LVVNRNRAIKYVFYLNKNNGCLIKESNYLA